VIFVFFSGVSILYCYVIPPLSMKTCLLPLSSVAVVVGWYLSSLGCCVCSFSFLCKTGSLQSDWVFRFRVAMLTSARHACQLLDQCTSLHERLFVDTRRAPIYNVSGLPIPVSANELNIGVSDFIARS
jgi:hypothetical protein